MMNFLKGFFQRLGAGLAVCFFALIFSLFMLLMWGLWIIVIELINNLGIFTTYFVEILISKLGFIITLGTLFILIIGDFIIDHVNGMNKSKELSKELELETERKVSLLNEIDRFRKELYSERQVIAKLKAKLSKRRKR